MNENETVELAREHARLALAEGDTATIEAALVALQAVEIDALVAAHRKYLLTAVIDV
jgi:hypothetical protein